MTEVDPEVDPLMLYLGGAECVTPLTHEEEVELATQAASNDPERAGTARRKLVEANLRLAAVIAGEYQDQGLPLIVLIQHANLGLMRAVDEFDYRVHDDLATFATPLIRQQIVSVLPKQSKVAATGSDR